MVDVIDLRDGASSVGSRRSVDGEDDSPPGRRIQPRRRVKREESAHSVDSGTKDVKKQKSIANSLQGSQPSDTAKEVDKKNSKEGSTVPSTSYPLHQWKQIEDFLRCEICKQLLDVPVSLSRCCHTFCSFCIRRYFEFSGCEGCPVCRVGASSSDVRLEPRLAGILAVLGDNRGAVRKDIRRSLRKSIGEQSICDSTGPPSFNETFLRQHQLGEFFKAGGTPVTRTPLPLYKTMTPKQLRDLFKENCLTSVDLSPLSRDDLVRLHKEFVFSIQAAHDAVRMGMYQAHGPTVEGVARMWNWMHAKGGTQNFFKKKRFGGSYEGSDSAVRKQQSVALLQQAAQKRMHSQLLERLAKRPREAPGTETTQ